MKNVAKWILLICAAGLVKPVQGQKLPADSLLLKNYRPHSIYRIPKTDIRKVRYRVIDIHSHPYASSPEEIDRWVQIMDSAGIEKTVILTQTVGMQFDSIFAQYARYPDRFDVWCGFDYSGYDSPGFGPAAITELERCVKVGAKGVGELGDKGRGLFYCPTKAWGMHLDDPRMDGLLERCADLHLPVSIHVADPKWMYEPMDSTNDGLMNAYEWRLDNQEGIVDHAGMIDILDRTAARHPRTILVACHLANCCYDLNRLGDLLDRHPNLYADISARYAETAPIPRFVRAFLKKYRNRLLYGTDMGNDLKMYRITFRILESMDEHFYEIGQFGYHWALNGFGLDPGTLKRIYRQNTLKIYR